MNLEDISLYLSQVENRALREADTQLVRDSISYLKAEAVKSANQELAKKLWCYETILHIQSNYLAAFYNMKDGAYYEAWCILERMEIDIDSLRRHFDVSSRNDRYKISFIRTHIEQFQSLFPYKLFWSPGILHLEKRCSICNKVIRLRNNCGHAMGEIYDGEMCVHETTEAMVVEVALVTNPVQKSSVAFIDHDENQQVDKYNYALVNYVIRRLRDPFHRWDVHRTKRRQPHDKFRNVGRNDLCPCESGKKYKLCCLKEEGVLRPHVEITFDAPPPDDLPPIEYNY